MNNIHPEDLLQIAQRKHREDLAEVRIRRATRKSYLNFWLAWFGTVMIKFGEKLQARYFNSTQINSFDFAAGEPNHTGEY